MILGLDVGGSRMKAVLLEGTRPVERRVLPRPSTPREMVEALRNVWGSWPRFQAAGVALAGLVKENRILQAPNLPRSWWVSAEDLQELLGVPVVVENDVNAALVAEIHLGAGRGMNSAALIALGTGVGGALWLDGHLWKGMGLAGEVGHTALAPLSGPVCRCGNRGCVEAFLGGWAVRNWIETNRAQGRIPETIASTEDLARWKDERAEAFWESYGTCLAHTIVNLLHLLDLEGVIVGGGLARAWERFSPSMFRVLARTLLSSSHRYVRVVQGALLEEAGAVGAAILAEKSGGTS